MLERKFVVKMTTLRPFRAVDLFDIAAINLDPLTETFNTHFYLSYLAKWPELCRMAQANNGSLAGYMLGKAEGKEEKWHGHVTAVTVKPEYRRLHLANRLMQQLEKTSEEYHDAYFVDLYVRASNKVAQTMYGALGYVIYRRVLGYYSGKEDAFDMHKALRRDVHRKSMIPLLRPVEPNANEDE